MVAFFVFWAHSFAGLRVDDTQVDLMGGSDEASNERPSFVVPTGRTLRRKREKRGCTSCQEDAKSLRKEEKCTVLTIVRHKVGRQKQFTVLINQSKQRQGRNKGRSVSFGRCALFILGLSLTLGCSFT